MPEQLLFLLKNYNGKAEPTSSSERDRFILAQKLYQ